MKQKNLLHRFHFFLANAPIVLLFYWVPCPLLTAAGTAAFEVKMQRHLVPEAEHAQTVRLCDAQTSFGLTPDRRGHFCFGSLDSAPRCHIVSY